MALHRIVDVVLTEAALGAIGGDESRIDDSGLLTRTSELPRVGIQKSAIEK